METRQSVSEEQGRFLVVLQRLREERDTAVQLLKEEAQRRQKQSKFSDTLIRDLDEMGKAFERTRQRVKELRSELAQKKAEIDRLRDEKLIVLKLALESGPRAFYDWIRQEMIQGGLEPGPDFDDIWQAWVGAHEDAPASSVSSRSGEDEIAISVCSRTDGDSMCIPLGESTGEIFPMIDGIQVDGETARSSNGSQQALDNLNLVMAVFRIIWEEGALNVQFVLRKGFFFIPAACFCFWTALTFRIMWQVTERTLRYFFLPLRQDVN